MDEVVRDALIGYSRSAEHLISHGLRRASFPSRGSHATYGGYWMFTLSFEISDRFGECHTCRFAGVLPIVLFRYFGSFWWFWRDQTRIL